MTPSNHADYSSLSEQLRDGFQVVREQDAEHERRLNEVQNSIKMIEYDVKRLTTVLDGGDKRPPLAERVAIVEHGMVGANKLLWWAVGILGSVILAIGSAVVRSIFKAP